MNSRRFIGDACFVKNSYANKMKIYSKRGKLVANNLNMNRIQRKSIGIKLTLVVNASEQHALTPCASLILPTSGIFHFVPEPLMLNLLAKHGRIRFVKSRSKGLS